MRIAPAAPTALAGGARMCLALPRTGGGLVPHVGRSSGGSSLLALALCLAGTPQGVRADASQASPARTFTIGIIPQAPPVVMHQRWVPVAERLSRESGVALKVKVYETMDSFEGDLAAGAVDLAFLTPIQAAASWAGKQLVPLVRDRRPIRGVLLVRSGAPYRTVEELRGKSTVLVGKKNVCSTLLRHELAGLGLVIRYVGSAQNVAKSVLVGEAEAGGTLDTTLDSGTWPPEAFRVIYQTGAIAAHPIAARADVPEAVRRALTEAILRLATTDQGRTLLATIRMEDPVVADFARDYQAVEPLTRPGAVP
jgi:phosphonate transport system substrate-binding protein